MERLYFTEKDLDKRQAEWRRLFWREVEEEQLKLAKARVEQALKIEFAEALGAERYERLESRKGYRGGYRYRDLMTLVGRLRRVRVPKGERGHRFKLLDPWKRHVEKFGEAVYRAFVYGMSDRKVARFFEGLYAERVLTAAGVSTVYRSLCGAVREWHERPLTEPYRFLYLDGFGQAVRGCWRGRKVVLAAMGVTASGRVELLDFRMEMGESSSAWSRFLQDLYERGLEGEGLELIVHDGAPGLIEALRFLWPQARTQVCGVHHLRNLGDGVKARHVRRRILREAKGIYEAADRAEAMRRAQGLAKRWRRCEPGPIRRFLRGLDRTLVYMEFPRELWPLLKSTNPLERFFGEWRRRLKVLGALPNEQSLDRLLYALSLDFNGLGKRRALPKSELSLT